MGECLVRLTHPDTGRTVYAEWSSIVDAPTTIYCDLKDLADDLELWATEPTRHAISQFEMEEAEHEVAHRRSVNARRLERLETYGCSALYWRCSGEELVACNRAGPGETELSLGDLVDHLLRQLEAA